MKTTKKYHLDYTVKSWIVDLDVEPYKIDLEEAKQYAEHAPGLGTPEEIMEAWNRIVDELSSGINPDTEFTEKIQSRYYATKYKGLYVEVTEYNEAIGEEIVKMQDLHTIQEASMRKQYWTTTAGLSEEELIRFIDSGIEREARMKYHEFYFRRHIV